MKPELTVHITYFPMEGQYGASLWFGDKMVSVDYNLYDTKQKALKMGRLLKNDYIKSNNEGE